MPDRVYIFQQVSGILMKHYCIRHSEGACSTTAFASKPPGAGVRQKIIFSGSLQLKKRLHPVNPALAERGPVNGGAEKEKDRELPGCFPV